MTALQQIDTTGGPPPGPHDLSRGKPLAMRDTYTREAITALQGMIDSDAVTAVWEAALQAPEWNRPYYLDTNPVGVGNARRAIDEVLADHKESDE